MKVTVIIFCLIIGLSSKICSEPQKTFYMSYSALSKRDAITNLFQEIDAKMTIHETNYTDGSLMANFSIFNMTPQTYYNDHYQVQSYLDKYKVNVTMGPVNLAERFNYEIHYSSETKNGWALGRGIFDPSYFTKNLSMSDGFITWQPDMVPALTFTQFIIIEHSEPALTSDENNVLTKMLNDQAGTKRLRAEIILEVNSYFGPLLKYYLNHEELIGTTSITYKYNNITLSFNHFPKDFYASNNLTKGFEAFFLFGLQSSEENCTVLPKEFNEDQYGGLQEIYSFSSLRAMLKQGLTKGLFDVNLDKTWEVNGFQFFMGDLGNSIDQANQFPAGDRFGVNCTLDSSKLATDLALSRYDQHDIYLTVPEKCSIVYAEKVIVNFEMDINMVVRLFAQENNIRAVVMSTGIFGIKYTSVDPKFIISNVYIAHYSITEVINGLVGKQVFGTGFPIVYRRYPVLRVLEDMLIIFDPSEA